LEQAKARGRTLGHPRIEELRGKDAVTLKAEERVLPQIEAARPKGLTTLRAMAAELEPLQVKAPRDGTTWGLHRSSQYPQAQARELVSRGRSRF
jgi:hypothetical protein